ncbi:hypothetical protein DFS34DRAFT_489042 [Phlyctochytrium arcticum]|nr:hypothetical protein DFS34DRAFT_489042 [Phlyctochytrium arcticum]
MGLCKCRNVTSLFCFSHRANVCETCLLREHQRCKVATYLQWLKNSEFSDHACSQCGGSLAMGPVVRIPCLHSLHVTCLPPVPPGTPIDCKACGKAVPSNQDSPIGDSLRRVLEDRRQGHADTSYEEPYRHEVPIEMEPIRKPSWPAGVPKPIVTDVRQGNSSAVLDPSRKRSFSRLRSGLPRLDRRLVALVIVAGLFFTLSTVYIHAVLR